MTVSLLWCIRRCLAASFFSRVRLMSIWVDIVYKSSFCTYTVCTTYTWLIRSYRMRLILSGFQVHTWTLRQPKTCAYPSSRVVEMYIAGVNTNKGKGERHSWLPCSCPSLLSTTRRSIARNKDAKRDTYGSEEKPMVVKRVLWCWKKDLGDGFCVLSQARLLIARNKFAR